MMQGFWAIAAIACSLMGLLASPAAAQEGTYELTIVRAPAPYGHLHFQAVNSLGEAAGIAFTPFHVAVMIRRADGALETPPRLHGCKWKDYRTYRVLRYTNSGQLLLSACDKPTGSTDSALFTPATGWSWVELPTRFRSIHANAMSDDGTVVGTAFDTQLGVNVGFKWRGRDDFETMAHDAGISFVAINERGDIAATVTHRPDKHKQYDREGITAALIPHGTDKVIYTGDGNIDTMEEYKDEADWWYEVQSHVVGINDHAELALDSPWAHGHRGRITSCRWERSKGVDCTRAHFSGHDSLLPIGIDGAGNVVMRNSKEFGTSYLWGKDGLRRPLNILTDKRTADLIAYAISEEGVIVGRASSWGRFPFGFILTPIAR